MATRGHHGSVDKVWQVDTRERAQAHTLTPTPSGVHQGAAELTRTRLRMEQTGQRWIQQETEKGLDNTGRKWVENPTFFHTFQPRLSCSV